MQSTVDWLDKMSTMFQTESNSSEDMATAMLRRGSVIANVPFKAANVVIGVLGIVGTLANLVVLFGFWLAGRSKMNVSSAYIANHTTLEQRTFSSTDLTNTARRFEHGLGRLAVEPVVSTVLKSSAILTDC